jgi:hypothetical protein
VRKNRSILNCVCPYRLLVRQVFVAESRIALGRLKFFLFFIVFQNFPPF